MKQSVIVLHSGGLDSTVCVLLAVERGRQPVSLGIDYGQRGRIELEYAADFCKRFGISRRVLRMEWDKPDRVIPEKREIEEIKMGMSTAFLPGRNAVFLAVACAEACGIGACEVWTGINSIDYSGYPDCRPEFVNRFEEMIRVAIPNGPSVVAPLISMSKPEIAKEAFRLGIRPGDTWSCYRPVETASGLRRCGICDACVLHRYAWDKALGSQHTDTTAKNT